MKLFRYFLVGGTAAVTDISIFAVLVKIYHLPWFPVAIFSFLVATAVNYILSILFVFKSGIRFERNTEIVLVFLVSGVGLLLNQSFLWILIEKLLTDELLAKFAASALVFIWNYTLRSRFVFNSGRHHLQDP